MSKVRPSELPEMGDAVRRRREQLGLTRLQLSMRLGWGPGQRTGWSPRTLVRIENGDRPLSHRGELVHLAVALELSEDQLLGDPPDLPAVKVRRAATRSRTTEQEIADALNAVLAAQKEQTKLLQRIAAGLDGHPPGRGD